MANQKTVLEALQELAVDEANRPGAFKWVVLRDACARELAGAGLAAGDVAVGGQPALPPGVVITEDMIDRAIVASYAAAQPPPRDGTPQERIDAMRLAEREQIRAALTAALAAPQ